MSSSAELANVSDEPAVGLCKNVVGSQTHLATCRLRVIRVSAIRECGDLVRKRVGLGGGTTRLESGFCAHVTVKLGGKIRKQSSEKRTAYYVALYMAHT